jgi:hypothetical protein
MEKMDDHTYPGPTDLALVIPGGDVLFKIPNIKQFPIIEIRKSKQCLILEGVGH